MICSTRNFLLDILRKPGNFTIKTCLTGLPAEGMARQAPKHKITRNVFYDSLVISCFCSYHFYSICNE